MYAQLPGFDGACRLNGLVVFFEPFYRVSTHA